jgi:hypothetical protein
MQQNFCKLIPFATKMQRRIHVPLLRLKRIFYGLAIEMETAAAFANLLTLSKGRNSYKERDIDRENVFVCVFNKEEEKEIIVKYFDRG